MNPFTESLLRQLEDDQLADWVTKWDELEALIIEVYRAGQVSDSILEEYRGLKEELLAGYQAWRPRLKPHWRDRQAGGRTINNDPFLELLSAEAAGEFVDNWQAVQLLPAAREALNSFLLARIERDSANNG